MLQKFSLIQDKINNDNIINSFKSEIRNLNEKYEILHESFGIVNGKASVINKGYLEVTGEFDTIDEALKNFNSLNNILYIIDDENFIVGNYSNVIKESEDTQFIDLSTLRFI